MRSFSFAKDIIQKYKIKEKAKKSKVYETTFKKIATKKLLKIYWLVEDIFVNVFFSMIMG